MKNYSKEQALKIMTSVSENYDKKLKDKLFLIVYQEDINIRTVQVGFRTGKSVDFPVTLYNEDIRKLTQPTCKVLAIFRKEYNEKYYMKCTYLSKGQDMNKLLLLEEVKELVRIDDDIEVLDRDNEKFISEDAPLPDEIESIERANRSIAENGIISHDTINWG